MGTHPIFESDFDCLTEWHHKVKEAKVEIAKFTKERESEFKAKEADILGGKEEYLQKINFETEQKLAEMNHRVQQKEQLVINDLVAQVANIVPQLPQNYVAGV